MRTVLLRATHVASLALVGVLLIPVAAPAADSPSSIGEASRVDTPILRVPFTRKPPRIDGVMDDGEWEDASALSAFWYDWAQARFFFLAPIQTQLQVFAAYDRENLYIAYTSPVYPENSWLKARGRFPDLIGHPRYGLQWDDHVELELRPYHDLVKAFRMGLFKWFINPIGTATDQCWSPGTGGGLKWQARAKITSQVTPKQWTLEIAVPLKSMAYGLYAGTEADGKPIVQLPPPDGTAYRSWFTRAIGGNGPFFNAFDNHWWNTTKTKLILDSRAPSFQVNELGPIMDDVIDLTFTVKNHNTRSETIRIGFFAESAEGLIYSTYDAPELTNGLIELRPGEVKKLRLKHPFPGISESGNVLWFDVRSAATPAKSLFRTRLIRFHSMDLPGFRARRIEIIATLRPPRKDFECWHNFSTYTKRLSVIVDKGLYGGSSDAKSAVDAKLIVMTDTVEESTVTEKTVPFTRDFACIITDLPKLAEGRSYKMTVLLFDRNKRIVGESALGPFTYEIAPWQTSSHGSEDRVWEPFTPIRKSAGGFETLKHRFTIAPSGLPEQIFIRPDVRELPLEKRAPDAQLSDAELVAIGRGPQLRAPVRLEAVVDGRRTAAEVIEPAKLIRQGASEFEYASKLRAGGLDVDLRTQYDCDGTLHCTIAYGATEPVRVESFEMLLDAAGPVNLLAGHGASECTLPEKEGVVWQNGGEGESAADDSTQAFKRFQPFLFFGSPDRGWTWFADRDRDWTLERQGPSMYLQRNQAGEVTWRTVFVNHKAAIQGRKTIKFTLITHPTRSKPTDFRKIAWMWRGPTWAAGYILNILKSDAELRRIAPKTPWRKDQPPWPRWGILRNASIPAPNLDR
ncbi:MAG TPA: hypothetical protein VMZ50_00525, partial [Phycisphaerae bacterium]|nr:hypothetical protein [Phycisphaerae bacterium]